MGHSATTSSHKLYTLIHTHSFQDTSAHIHQAIHTFLLPITRRVSLTLEGRFPLTRVCPPQDKGRPLTQHLANLWGLTTVSAFPRASTRRYPSGKLPNPPPVSQSPPTPQTFTSSSPSYPHARPSSIHCLSLDLISSPQPLQLATLCFSPQLYGRSPVHRKPYAPVTSYPPGQPSDIPNRSHC